MSYLRIFAALSSLALLSGCVSTLSALRGPDRNLEVALNEVRLELADVKHEIHGYQVEIQILEEKIKTLTSSPSGKSPSKEQSSKLDYVSQQVSLLEKKIQLLESTQEKTVSDLHHLTSHANQTSESLLQYKTKIQHIEKDLSEHNSRLNEIRKLASTLSSLSSAIKEEKGKGGKTYQIRPGDTLGKIAHEHHTTIEAIKKINQIENDRIIVGQEIKIPHD